MVTVLGLVGAAIAMVATGGRCGCGKGQRKGQREGGDGQRGDVFHGETSLCPQLPLPEPGQTRDKAGVSTFKFNDFNGLKGFCRSFG
jgi:hypothetical protein